MESVDLKKLDIAITYVNRMAEGKNPINNFSIDDDTVLNNPNVIRCMYFIKEILEEVKHNEGYIGKRTKPKKSERAEFPLNELKRFSYTGDAHITYFVKQINELVDCGIYKKINYKLVVRWLLKNNLLQEVFDERSNTFKKCPTEEGLQLGIRLNKKYTDGGQIYESVVYNKTAQEFIIKNMEQILNYDNEYSDSQVGAKTEEYHYLDFVSNKSKEFVINLVKQGEPNLYHSVMAVINNKQNISKAELNKLYFRKYEKKRPYLLENRELVEEVLKFCWEKCNK